MLTLLSAIRVTDPTRQTSRKKLMHIVIDIYYDLRLVDLSSWKFSLYVRRVNWWVDALTFLPQYVHLLWSGGAGNDSKNLQFSLTAI